MKKILLFCLLSLGLILAVSSCEDYDVNVGGDPGVEVNVNLSPDESLDFTAEAGSADISVVTNMDEKYISIALDSKDDEWCSVKLEGTNINVSVSENIRYTSRSINLKVKVFNVTKIITINQTAKEFVVEPKHPIEGVYRINIPSLADFNMSKIYKAMDGQQKIVEIC